MRVNHAQLLLISNAPGGRWKKIFLAVDPDSVAVVLAIIVAVLTMIDNANVYPEKENWWTTDMPSANVLLITSVTFAKRM